MCGRDPGTTTTMTWRLLTFSSFLACAAALWGGAVTGRVELVDSDSAVSARTADLSGVVVWLEPRSGETTPPARRPAVATILQRDKRFTPHVLAIQVGTAVDFPNQDPIFHNAFSSFDGQIFDIGLYPPGTSRKVVFRRPGIVRVFCNIHPMMSAVIAVVPTPWFAVTNAEGLFRIDDLPPGDYRLHVFHERALPQSLAALARTLELGPEGADLGVLRVSESGYVPTPHKNKHGQDYPPQTDDHFVYPGGR